MRRVFVLLVVLGLLFAMPLTAASAQESFEVDIHTYGTTVGTDADGCGVSVGGFEVVFDGQVVETGQARLTTCPNEDASVVEYEVRYRDASTGNIINTVGTAYLIDADEDAGVFTYELSEEIVSSSDRTRGQAEGIVIVTATETGFDFVSWNTWSITTG